MRRRHTHIRVSYNTKNDDLHVERYDLLCNKFYDIAKVARQSESATKSLFNQL